MPDNTQLLSPEEARRQAQVYNELANSLESKDQRIELGESKVQPTKKDVSFSKGIINWSFIAFGIVGIVGSFWTQFDMIKFTNFLETFALIWAPLVISVGSGRAFKNFVSRKYDTKNNRNQGPPV